MSTIVLVRGTKKSSHYADRITAAMAANAMQRFQKRVLVLQATRRLPIETTMLGAKFNSENISTELNSFNDSGMDALMRRIEMGPLSHEQFSDCCVNIAKNMNGFDIAGVSKMPEFEKHLLDNFSLFKEMVKNAATIYDIIFIFADVKNADNTSLALLEQLESIADREIVCVPQGPAIEYTASPGAVFAVKNYDALSSFTSKVMSRMYGGKEVYPIPYNILFKDACLKEYAISFLYRNTDPEEFDDNSYFVESLTNIVGSVIGLTEYMPKEKQFVYKRNTGKKRNG